MSFDAARPPGTSAPGWILAITWIAVPLLVALDQWTKNFIVTYYYLWEIDPIIGNILRLTRVHNQGAAFGVLQEWPGLFRNLTGFAIVALTAHKALTRNQSLLYHAALGLVLSGAVGNFIDRIRYNYVVDFIQIGFNGWYWPSFNVADSAISVGVVLLLWGSFTLTEPDSSLSTDESGRDSKRDTRERGAPGRDAKDGTPSAETRS